MVNLEADSIETDPIQAARQTQREVLTLSLAHAIRGVVEVFPDDIPLDVFTHKNRREGDDQRPEAWDAFLATLNEYEGVVLPRAFIEFKKADFNTLGDIW